MLRDELELLREKCNRQVQAEARAEVYAQKLKEIPELK